MKFKINYYCYCGACFKTKTKLSRHRNNCVEFEKYINEYLSYDKFVYQYITLEKPFYQLLKEYDLNEGYLRKLFLVYDIRQRGIKESHDTIKNQLLRNNKYYETRICLTCQKEFKVSKKRNKRFCSTKCVANRKTRIKKDLPFIKHCLTCQKEFKTRREIQKYCSVKCQQNNASQKENLRKKAQERCRQNYNKFHELRICPTCGTEFDILKISKQKFCSIKCANNSTEVKKKIKKIKLQNIKNGFKPIQGGYGASKWSLNLINIITPKLNNINEIYFGKKEFGKYDIKNKKYYYYDFVDTKNKKIIEFNGDYWHMNPKLYETAQVNPTSKKSAKEMWDFDDQKINFIRSLGFEVLIIWESEYIHNKEDMVQRCLSFLNN